MRTFIKFLIIPLLLSCNKEKTEVPARAEIEHVDFNDTVFTLTKPILLDLNNDGRKDLLFHTEFFEGFPNDYSEFRVVPQIESAVLASSGIPKVFDKDAIIEFGNNPGFSWVDEPVVLAKKEYEIEIENSYWEGAWKNKENKYLGVQVSKNNKLYNAWLRISVVHNKTRMILHDAGVSKEPGRGIVAGQ